MTLGCKVNQYESTAIAEEFERHGFTIGRFSEKCGIYIINTCTVTGEGDRKTRQMIRRAARHNPDAYVLVTGCYAQLNPAKVAEIDGVDFVCGNSNKLKIVDAALGLIASGEKNRTADIKVENILRAGLEPMCVHSSDHTRAFLKIEDGCDNHCTYCIVPEARGKVRSKAPEEVIEEVRGLVKAGYREVVLTGIETASYGKDLHKPGALADLLAEVDKIGGIERIRLGSLEPSLLKPEFVGRIASLKHLAPSFHLSMQSGSSNILAAMKRKYNVETVLSYIENIKKVIPGVTFSADIIVGFPGETEEDFNATVDFVRKVGFIHLHVFQYSRRPGTPAAEMENQIPDEIKAERSARLEAIGTEILYEMTKEYIGEMRSVLFELCENGNAVGHTPEFLEVAVITSENLKGQIKTVKLNGFDGKVFSGFIV